MAVLAAVVPRGVGKVNETTTIDSWLKKYLDVEGLKEIEDSVACAEKSTSGEIVPVIVRSSSAVGHVPSMLFLIGMLAFTLVSLGQWPNLEWIHNWWVLPIWICLLVPLSGILCRLPYIQKLFISRSDAKMQAFHRANLEFYRSQIDQTQGSTGILLFVSLMERHAFVLADRGISEKLPSSTWDEVVSLLVEGAKKKDLATGFRQAIESCEEILKEHYPIKEDGRNELRNHLIIKE